MSPTGSLEAHCDLLRSLHVPGDPLVLPNAWDVATAKAVVAAGFPVVATTSGGVAATLGYEDHEGAPAEEMLAAAGRIVRGVDVPVTVDAEAGYGMEPAELAAALRSIGAAGCNLEDSDHAAGTLRDSDRHAEWLGAVREAASKDGYPLVINARVDVFLASAGPETQPELVPDAVLLAKHRVLRARGWRSDACRHRRPLCGLRLPRLPAPYSNRESVSESARSLAATFESSRTSALSALSAGRLMTLARTPRNVATSLS